MTKEERIIKVLKRMRENSLACADKLSKEENHKDICERLKGKAYTLLQVIWLLEDESYLKVIEYIFNEEE